MKYKALIFDLDGTAIEMSYDALPSKEVIEAVKKAKEKVIVSIATGRPISDCRHIIKILGIDKPCIVAGGTEIIDPKTEEVIWTKKIAKEDVKKIIEIGKTFSYKILLGEGIDNHYKRDSFILEEKKVIYIMNTDPVDAKRLSSEINNLKNVIAVEAGSWNEGKLDIHISNKYATKKHALIKWAEILKLEHQDIIAVGDRSNDLPLFEIAGFKIAVGNAVDELKAKADYIAPSVTENGLVDVINKFILK